MNCQRNVTSTLPTQLPHKFSYMVAGFIHNYFKSPNMYLHFDFDCKIDVQVNNRNKEMNCDELTIQFFITM
jgi:hypothetical protein